MNLTISPSQLAYALDGCPRCIWLKVRKIGPSGGDFSVFNMLDATQKELLPKGTGLHELGIPGKVHSFDGWLRSRSFDRAPHSLQIVSRYDLLAELDEGGYGVVDLKSSKPNPEKQIRYQKQLSAYTLAFREPERDIDRMDIRATYLCHWWPAIGTGHYQPEIDPPTMVTYFHGHAVEVPIDTDAVIEAMESVLSIATKNPVPDAADGCPNCNYIREYTHGVKTSKEAAKALAEPQNVATTATGPVADAQRHLASCVRGSAEYAEALAALNDAMRLQRQVAA